MENTEHLRKTALNLERVVAELGASFRRNGSMQNESQHFDNLEKTTRFLQQIVAGFRANHKLSKSELHDLGPSDDSKVHGKSSPTPNTVGNPKLEFIPSRLNILQIPGPFPFLMATMQEGVPYADGDVAQQRILSMLQLHDKCSQNKNVFVVDVGGFLGDFGLSAAAAGCKVIIFEVQPKMVEIIKLSVRLNNFEHLVDVRHNAVSAIGGNSLCFHEAGGQTNTDTPIGNEQKFCVETIRLDSVLESVESVVMLKVDVEGHELGVLKSASDSISQGKISNIITEFTAWWTDRDSQDKYLSYLHSLAHSTVYCLHRTGPEIYGPLSSDISDSFFNNHLTRHLQTDFLVTLAGHEWLSGVTPWSPDVLA